MDFPLWVSPRIRARSQLARRGTIYITEFDSEHRLYAGSRVSVGIPVSLVRTGRGFNSPIEQSFCSPGFLRTLGNKSWPDAARLVHGRVAQRKILP